MMRLFVGGLATETNSFSPLPTGLAAFEALGIRRSPDATANPAAVTLMLDAVREAAQAGDALMVEGLFAAAQPQGPVTGAAYRALRDELLSDLDAARADAALFVLHGAMIAEDCDDCEGDILVRARARMGPDAAIGVVCDPHCHLTAAMVEAADLIVAFKAYPHIDTAARAAEACGLTLATARGDIRPRMAVADCRMTGLWPTTEPTGAAIVEHLCSVEAMPGVLSASFGHGFPWGDVADAGAKCWVVTDDDLPLAHRLAGDLAAFVWERRDDSLPALVSVDTALDAVEQAIEGPLLLADMADNAGGGAASDSSFILRRLVERGIGDVALGCFWDPQAVTIAGQAGVGASLTLRIGGKTGPASGSPVDLPVTVMAIRERHGQHGFGTWLPFGASAWVRTAEGLDIVLVSERQQVLAPDAFTALGIALAAKRAIVVKSAEHFQAGFKGMGTDVLRVGTPGALDYDFAALPYAKRNLSYWPRVTDPFGKSS